VFLIDDASIQAIQATHARAGDLAAVVELRERFPGITSNAAALDAVRMVLTMKPDDGTITARLAALKVERRRAIKPREIVIRWD
jgi:hypothetical protein